MRFDPDALLAALPRREISRIEKPVPRAPVIVSPTISALGQSGEYNGFSNLERNRTARLSNRLFQLGATVRPAKCDICRCPAEDEHAENYYDLSRWIGLCRACHRSALHKRFKQSGAWFALLDRHQLPDDHWTRLVSVEPFDLARLLRSRGAREPTMAEFVFSAT